MPSQRELIRIGMTYPHDRAFYRLQYPPSAAPKFRTEGGEYRIVDLGEGGFRYANPAEPAPPPGQPVKGLILFPEDDPLEVAGVVVRFRDGEIAVHCNIQSIPLRIVLREQRRVRRKYPFRV